MSMTDPASVKEFWPGVITEFPPGILDKQLGFYIQRAEILLTQCGVPASYDPSFDDTVELAANMVVRRLVYADKHPAASAAPAGVRSETVHGISYSMFSASSDGGVADALLYIVGPEILAILGGVIDVDPSTSVGMETEVVFLPENIDVVRDGTLYKPYVERRLPRIIEPTIYNQRSFYEDPTVLGLPRADREAVKVIDKEGDG